MLKIGQKMIEGKIKIHFYNKSVYTQRQIALIQIIYHGGDFQTSPTFDSTPFYTPPQTWLLYE